MIADRIISDMAAADGTRPGDVGIMAKSDLANYQPIWRHPLVDGYRDATVVAMAPSTSGGVATLETLNILEGFDVSGFGQTSGDYLHVLAEAQKIAWADRGEYLADPAYVKVPTATLTSKTYAAKRRTEIDMQHAGSYQPGLGPWQPKPGHAGPSAPTAPPLKEGDNTTAIAVIDRAGDAVALTCTIEQAFGSAVVAPGTGFLLNGELHDFNGPGTANQPEGGKRPRSSIDPAIVVRNGEPVLVVAGAGGSFIPMGITQAIINVVDFNEDIAQAIDAQREDAQEEPLALLLEAARVPPQVVADLDGRGHNVVNEGEYGPLPHVNAAGIDPVTCEKLATSDPRDDSIATAAQSSSGSHACPDSASP